MKASIALKRNGKPSDGQKKSDGIPEEPDLPTDPDDSRVEQTTSEADESATKQSADDAEDTPEPVTDPKADRTPRGIGHARRVLTEPATAYLAIPIVALLMAIGAGYLKWHDFWVRDSATSGAEAVAVAKDATIALLSYQPESVEKDLKSARDRLTGAFRDSYTQLIQDVVIPGAKQKHISAVATVPASASVSATPKHAVALLFVDQTTVVGNDAPTDTASGVRVTLDRIDGRWLISAFDPV